MASDTVAVNMVLDALTGLNVETRYVFQGDCLYCDAKPVGWINEDAFYLKNTGKNLPETRGLPMEVTTCKPHPSFFIPKEFYHAEWFKGAVQATADALPDSQRRW
ncbi:hypothetical protein SDC9_179076 [bioreactor metagenome]|uniref:Uncharacterized protein n=1 Tax=bioreactor metagenome TaxID=1076179 RepID=A0A645GZX6_9ZZZZ